jgi:syntaxin 1B/2/3
MTPVTKGNFMKDFFEKVNEINAILSKGKGNVKEMGEVLEEALQATTQERQRAASDKIAELVEDTNKQVHDVKRELEDMKQKTDEQEKLENQTGEKAKTREIRNNMQNQLARKQCQLLSDFQQAQMAFKDAVQQQQARELHMVLPELSESEVRQKVQSGETATLLVAQQMAGTHHELIDEINRIKEKHQDILRLERSMADLTQMMKEMAILVDQQGEMLDSIEVNVHQAKNYTAKAEEALIQTRKYQHSANRWMCCLAAVMLILLMAILLPVILGNTR